MDDDDALLNGLPFEWISTIRGPRLDGEHDEQSLFQPFDINLLKLDSTETLTVFGSDLRLELPDLLLSDQQHDDTHEDEQTVRELDREHTSSDHQNGEEPDIWRFDVDLQKRDPTRSLLSWETFEKQDLQDLESPHLLSEAGPRVFDAAICPVAQSPNAPGVLPQDVMHTALCNLALGRSSVFFQWDAAKQQFERTLKEAPISGLSSQCTASFLTKVAEFGALYRSLVGASVKDSRRDRCCTAVVAFQRCIASILDGLESILTGTLPRSRSLLQLQQSLEIPSELLSVLHQLDGALISSKCATDEELITVLADRVHFLAGAGHPFCEVLYLILARTSSPWLDRLSMDLGLPGAQGAEHGLRNGWHGLDQPSDETELDSTNLPSLLDVKDHNMIRETRAGLRLLRQHFPAHQATAAPTSQNYLMPLDIAEPPLLGKTSADVIEEGSIDTENLVWADNSKQEAYIADLDARINQYPSSATSYLDNLRMAVIHVLDQRSDNTSSHDRADISDPFNGLRFDPLAQLRHSLQKQHQGVNEALLLRYFEDLQLRRQFDLQQQFHLFGNGAFVSRLSIALFSEETQSAERKRGIVPTGETMGLRLGARQGQRWPPASSELRLTLLGILNETYIQSEDTDAALLAKAETKELPGGLSFSIRELPDEEIEKVMDPSSIFALDFLRLSYTPSPPLDTIFTPAAMQAYDDIFRFVLKVFRVLHVTTKLRMQTLLGHRRSHLAKSGRKPLRSDEDDPQVIKFSTESHTFVSTLLTYTVDVAIQTPWQSFMASLDAIQSTTLDASHRESHQFASSTSSSTRNSERATKTEVAMASPERIREMHEACLEKIKTRLFLRHRDGKLLSALEDVLAAVLRCAGLLEEKTEAQLQGRRELGEQVGHYEKAVRSFRDLIQRRVERGSRKIGAGDFGEESAAEAFGILLGKLNRW